MRTGNCVAIGWSELGDLSGVESVGEAKEQWHQRMAERYPGPSPRVKATTYAARAAIWSTGFTKAIWHCA